MGGEHPDVEVVSTATDSGSATARRRDRLARRVPRTIQILLGLSSVARYYGAAVRALADEASSLLAKFDALESLDADTKHSVRRRVRYDLVQLAASKTLQDTLTDAATPFFVAVGLAFVITIYVAPVVVTIWLDVPSGFWPWVAVFALYFLIVATFMGLSYRGHTLSPPGQRAGVARRRRRQPAQARGAGMWMLMGLIGGLFLFYEYFWNNLHKEVGLGAHLLASLGFASVVFVAIFILVAPFALLEYLFQRRVGTNLSRRSNRG